MAAYAALCSLMHIIHQIQNHPRSPVSLDEQQVESLTEKVTFLQEFFEGYSDVGGYTKEADPLESCIADAAHAAEDVIESHIVDRIHAGFTSHGVEMSSSVDFYQSLQKVIGKMDSIKKQVMEMKNRMRVGDHQQRGNWITSANSSRPTSTVQDTMVGFDDALLEIMDKLTGGDPGRQVIPIVGMGGMGKTTLTRNVYVNPLIQQYFDICAWATISQEYNTQEIFREILRSGNKEELSDVEVLGEKLHKYLSGRRYLIVLDDMWSIKAWDEVRRFFPDNSNGSRIVITTRLSNMTSQLTGSYYLEMSFLDYDKSWDLLNKTVFAEEDCPPELVKIGKKIAQNCRGLPLSIVVIGGLLVKSKHSLEYWEYIAENLNSVVNSEDNERCLKILYMSYKQMPVHLKPCFLYMGIFSEDSVIGASQLIRLWVTEGFLKPVRGKSLEEIAEECLEELIDRNLVRASSHLGKVKRCRIHDLLRDLCLREAQKERFYYVTKEHRSNLSSTQRRIVISKREFENEVLEELQSMSLARSLICKAVVVPSSLDFRLLRILNAFSKKRCSLNDRCSLEKMFHFINSRYLAIHVHQHSNFPSSVSLLWNLHTLKVDCAANLFDPDSSITAPNIWMMPQLRHVDFNGGLYLPDPPTKDDDDGTVLTNLQSLSTILDFKCSDEVVKRIPNLKKLKLHFSKAGTSSHCFLNKLDRLHKLESFKYSSFPIRSAKATDTLLQLSFPQFLKKLTLKVYHVQWDNIMEKIGSLPLLEVLKLTRGFFRNCEWETVEGQFSNLKFLRISSVYDLEYWNSESTHFPCLQQLVLKNLRGLKEIPSGIGEIATLRSIDLTHCSYSAAVSARKILEEQEDFGDVTLQVRVIHFYKDEKEALESLASPNFQFQDTQQRELLYLQKA